MTFQHCKVTAHDQNGYVGNAFFDSSLNKYFVAGFSEGKRFINDVSEYLTAEKIELTQISSSILIATYDSVAEQVTVNVGFDTLTQEECTYLTGSNKLVFVAAALNEFANK